MESTLGEETFLNLVSKTNEITLRMASDGSHNTYDMSLWAMGILFGYVLAKEGKAPDDDRVEHGFKAACSKAELCQAIAELRNTTWD